MTCVKLLYILALKFGIVQEVEERTNPKTGEIEITRIVPIEETIERVKNESR